MADRPLFTTAAALAGSEVVAVSLADSAAVPAVVSKLRLFDDSFVPDVGTVRADLVAAETALTGYPVGGYSITDFGVPKKAPLGGAVSTSNLIEIAYASGAAAVIGGYWIEDNTPVTPQVRLVQIYDPPRTLASLGDGWEVVVQLGYGANASV